MEQRDKGKHSELRKCEGIILIDHKTYLHMAFH